MELDDARRAHRTLVGPDLLANVRVDRAQVRRQCEHEARAKLLRLRAALPSTRRPRGAPRALLVESAEDVPRDPAPRAATSAATTSRSRTRTCSRRARRCSAPLPAFAACSSIASGVLRLPSRELRTEFSRYLADAERVVAAVDTLHA
jgi:hypothetical protein